MYAGTLGNITDSDMRGKQDEQGDSVQGSYAGASRARMSALTVTVLLLLP